MPPKKKDKKPPLTEEEKIARAEMMALQAEEERKRREEDAKLRLREKQLAEEKYTKINSLKIHTQWRKFMRKAKVEELRREIEILSQAHEREVDRKDAIIQMLEQDLAEAEEQYQVALRAHLKTVDALIDLQFTRIKALEDEFTAQLHLLTEEFDTERVEIVSAHTRQKKDLTDILGAMDAEFKEAEAEARQDFESQREEIKNRNSEEYNVLKISLESTIEELERHFEQAHQAYLASTDARTQSFRELTERDAASARVIERRMRRLIHLHESLAHWRTKIATNGREWEKRNQALRAEKDMMARHYRELKRRMEGFRGDARARLKTLSKASGQAIAELKQHLEKASKIIKIGELCHKLETEQEKVLPFFPAQTSLIGAEDPQSETGEAARGGAGGAEGAGLPLVKAIQSNSLRSGDGVDDTPLAGHELGLTTALAASGQSGLGAQLAGARPKSETGGKQQPQLSTFAVDDEGKVVEEWDYLSRFYVRYNKVLLDKMAIEKERERLGAENAQLKHLLKQYLNGISVNQEVINDPVNPLLIVNERLQHHVTEANRDRMKAVFMDQTNMAGVRGQSITEKSVGAPVLQYAIAN